jgi:hypothetical protein
MTRRRMTKQRRNFSGHCRVCGKFKVNGHKGDERKQTIIARLNLNEAKEELLDLRD